MCKRRECDVNNLCKKWSKLISVTVVVWMTKEVSVLTFPSAVDRRKILMTTDFIRAGALLYAYSMLVIDANISDRAIRTWVILLEFAH